MKEFNFLFKLGFQRGLRKSAQNLRNQQALVQSTGAVPYDGALGALPELSEIDISAISPAPSFPYPQIFRLKRFTLVCTETQIYERDSGGSLTLAYSGLTGGLPWTVADFHSFLVLANGKQLVFKNADTGEWTTNNRYSLPSATSVTNFKGQLILTAPDTTIPDGGI